MPVARYHCDVCILEQPDEPIKVWKRKGDFNRHLKTHSSHKDHLCSWPGCTKGFVQYSALKTHLNTHTGQKPHMCDFPGCGKCFGDPSSCSRHRKEAHSDVIGYRCPYDGCPTKIKRKATFIRHLFDNHDLLRRPTEEQLLKMSVFRPKQECEEFSVLDAPRKLSCSPSLSASPLPLHGGVYSLSPAATSKEDLYYDSYFSHSFHGHYSPHHADESLMASLQAIPLFGSMPLHDYSRDASYDDGLLLSGSSTSSSPAATGMISWDIDPALYSADRSGYASLPPLYDC